MIFSRSKIEKKVTGTHDDTGAIRGIRGIRGVGRPMVTYHKNLPTVKLTDPQSYHKNLSTIKVTIGLPTPSRIPLIAPVSSCVPVTFFSILLHEKMILSTRRILEFLLKIRQTSKSRFNGGI
ncbi:hypothetical protein M0802_008651 [Mischocyttarus mexicanus]|nr:hypothetical protein M0802_008651 [Mischocyttarus mexicanus]